MGCQSPTINTPRPETQDVKPNKPNLQWGFHQNNKPPIGIHHSSSIVARSRELRRRLLCRRALELPITIRMPASVWRCATTGRGSMAWTRLRFGGTWRSWCTASLYQRGRLQLPYYSGRTKHTCLPYPVVPARSRLGEFPSGA